MERYLLTTKSHLTGEIGKIFTVDGDSAQRVFEGLSILLKTRLVDCTISLYREGELIRRDIIVGGVVK